MSVTTLSFLKHIDSHVTFHTNKKKVQFSNFNIFNGYVVSATNKVSIEYDEYNIPTTKLENRVAKKFTDKISPDFIKAYSELQPSKENNTIIYRDFIWYLFDKRVLAITDKSDKSSQKYFENAIKILSLYNYENILYFFKNSNFVDNLLKTKDKHLYNQLICLLSNKITNEVLSAEQNDIIINITNKIAEQITVTENVSNLVSIKRFYKLLYLISHNYQNINTVTLILFNMISNKNANNFFNVIPTETGKISNNYFEILAIIAMQEISFKIPKIAINKNMSQPTTKLIKDTYKNNNLSYVLLKNIIPYIKDAIKIKSTTRNQAVFFALGLAKILMSFENKHKKKILNKLNKDKSINNTFKETLFAQLKSNEYKIPNEKYNEIFLAPINPYNYVLSYDQAKKLNDFDNPRTDNFDKQYELQLKFISGYDTNKILLFLKNSNFIHNVLCSGNKKYFDDLIELIFIKTANSTLTEDHSNILYDLCRYIFMKLDQSVDNMPDLYGKLYQTLAVLVYSNKDKLISLLNERLDKGDINGCFNFKSAMDQKIVCGYMSLLLLLSHNISSRDNNLINLIEKSLPFINKAINKNAEQSADEVTFFVVYFKYIMINFSVEQQQEFIKKLMPNDLVLDLLNNHNKIMQNFADTLTSEGIIINRFKIQDIVIYYNMLSTIVGIDSKNIVDAINIRYPELLDSENYDQI